jgi:hypothetical protein
MKSVKPLLLAGLASVAVAGYAGFAHAGTPDVKTMTVQLPGGGIEEIEYTGTVAPQVILAPALPADAALMPMAPPGDMTDPFAALEQLSAEMDQQAAAMINAANAMAADAMGPSGPLVPAGFAQMPPSSTGFSFVSSVSGGGQGACMQSLEITSMGNGQAPRVVSHSSGNCGGGGPSLSAPGGAIPAALPAALPGAPVPVQSQPQLIRVRYIEPQRPVHPSNS